MIVTPVSFKNQLRYRSTKLDLLWLANPDQLSIIFLELRDDQYTRTIIQNHLPAFNSFKSVFKILNHKNLELYQMVAELARLVSIVNKK